MRSSGHVKDGWSTGKGDPGKPSAAPDEPEITRTSPAVMSS